MDTFLHNVVSSDARCSELLIKVLAVTFVKIQHLHFKRKLLARSIIWVIPFPVVHWMNDYESYAHFNSPIQTSIEKKWRRSACTALIRKIQYLHEDYLMGQTVVCNFPVLAWSHSGERAVSLKKVNLPESLPQIIVISWFLVQTDCVGIFVDFGWFLQSDGQKCSFCELKLLIALQSFFLKG